MTAEGALSASIVSNLKKEILTGKLANGTGPESAELLLHKCDRLRAHLQSLPAESKQRARLRQFLEALQLQVLGTICKPQALLRNLVKCTTRCEHLS